MTGLSARPHRLLVRTGRVLGLLVLILALLPLLLPLPPATGLREPEELADPDGRFVDLGDIAVHHKVAGDGETALVLLHGFGASTFSWRHVIEPLAAAGYRVIAFDRPGFGLTERPLPGEWGTVNPYSDEGYVRLTGDLLRELGVSQAVLVGHSAGGSLAVSVAERYPELVQGLVLVAPALGQGPDLAPFLRWLATTPQGRRIGRWAMRAVKPSLGRVLVQAWHDSAGPDAATTAGYELPLQARNWDGALWELTMATRIQVTAATVARLDLPVLYVTGDDDRIIQPATTRAAAAATPGATLVEIASCGHLPQEERPAEFLTAVNAYLGRLLDSAAGP